MTDPVHLNYIEKGLHQDTLVLLHGFMGKAASFNNLIEKLSHCFRVIAIDLPGHGASRFASLPELNRLTSFSDVAQAVLDTLDTLPGTDNVYLYGYSMGGRVAQNVCILAPGRIRHLILESAAFGIQDTAERKQRYEKDRHLLSGITTIDDFQAFLRRWHSLPLFCTLARTPILDALTREKLKNSIPELQKALCLMSTGHHPFFAPALSHLKIPVSYFYGKKDEKYKTIALHTAKIIPRVYIHPVENASHNIHIQFPECIISLIIKDIFFDGKD